METIKLTVQEREETGNGPARRMRAEGMIPGVSYAKGQEPTPLVVSLNDLKAALAHGHNTVLELDFGKGAKGAKGKGKKVARFAVVKEMQFHPIRRNLLHIDLHEIDLAAEIEVTVPIELVGTPAGVSDGGILDWEHREVTVKALPADLPSSFELDVSELGIGHNLTVATLVVPAEVTIVDDPETVIAAVLAPRLAEELEEVEEGEELEPELIGEAGGEAEAEAETEE